MAAREGKKLVQVWMTDEDVTQMLDVCHASKLSRSDIVREAFQRGSFDYLLDAAERRKRKRMLKDLSELEVEIKRLRRERDRLAKQA